MDEEVLLELKLKHGPLYGTSVKGIDLLFRELKYSEFDKFELIQDSEGYSSADSEDYILETSIVYPENFNINIIPAGAVSSISDLVLEMSGFSSARTAKRILESKREKASEVRGLMKAFVLATISTYSPEDLDQMTYSMLAERVALAEKIIEVKQAINGMESTQVKLDLIDPEEEVIKQQQAAAEYNAKRKEGEAVYNDPIAQKLLGSL